MLVYHRVHVLTLATDGTGSVKTRVVRGRERYENGGGIVMKTSSSTFSSPL